MESIFNTPDGSSSNEVLSARPIAVEDSGTTLQLLTTGGVAHRLNVSDRTIYRLVESGELSPIDIRGAVRYHPDDVDELVERQRRPARTPTGSQPVRRPARRPQPATTSFRDRRRGER